MAPKGQLIAESSKLKANAGMLGGEGSEGLAESRFRTLDTEYSILVSKLSGSGFTI